MPKKKPAKLHKPRAELAPIDEETLRFYRDYLARRSFPPTMREAAEYLDLTVAAVAKRLKRLHRAGYIRLYRGAARGVQILD